jgi:hypothetical protein
MTRFREEVLHGNTGSRNSKEVTSHPGEGREVSFVNSEAEMNLKSQLVTGDA